MPLITKADRLAELAHFEKHDLRLVQLSHQSLKLCSLSRYCGDLQGLLARHLYTFI